MKFLHSFPLKTSFLLFAFVSQADLAGAERGPRALLHSSSTSTKKSKKSSSNNAFPQTDYGEKGELGDGLIRTFVKYANGMPLQLGVIFQESLFDNLPEAPSDGTYDVENCDPYMDTWFCCGHEVELDFPKVLKKLHLDHFDHFVVNWNPIGHGPPGIYEHPHFDFHFYTMTRKERLSVEAADQCYAVPDGYPFAGTPIPMTTTDYFRQMADLPCDMLPYGYARAPAVEAGMGAHMIQPASKEFNGEAFDETWIYGTQDGYLAFMESMITIAFLEDLKDSGENFENSISVTIDGTVPMKMPVAGYYPTTYSASYEPGFYTISLGDFAWFEETDGVTDGCVQPYPPPP